MHNKKKWILVLFLIPTLVQARMEDRAGLSGEISAIGGIILTDSNLSSKNDVKVGALNSRGDEKTNPIYGPLFNLNYVFGAGAQHKIFVGTTREDIAIGVLAAEIGYQYSFHGHQKVAISYLPSLIEETVWADPFILGTNKTETEKSGHAYRVQFKSIANIPVSLDFAYATNNVKFDSSGSTQGLGPSQQALLARDSDIYYSKLSYRQFLGRGFGVTPALSYSLSDAKGEAMMFQRMGTSVTLFSFLNRSKYFFTLSYEKDSYKESHPVFSEKREDRSFGGFLAYEFTEIFSVPQLSSIVLIGYNKNMSNIEFYSEKQLLVSTGMTFRF